jgi:PPOX class probable F420-dependent enzyme
MFCRGSAIPICRVAIVRRLWLVLSRCVLCSSLSTATADRHAVPHVVPVCFAMWEGTLYITIDEKPKRYPGIMLKRVRNIMENPAVAVVVDRYNDDWALLGWVMVRGRAEILTDGTEHDNAQALLRSRYPQLRRMQIAQYSVIAVRIERTTSWGNLSVAEAG